MNWRDKDVRGGGSLLPMRTEAEADAADVLAGMIPGGLSTTQERTAY